MNIWILDKLQLLWWSSMIGGWLLLPARVFVWEDWGTLVAIISLTLFSVSVLGISVWLLVNNTLLEKYK